MKRKSALALTLGLSLAVGSLTGTYTIAQANEKPAEIQNMQMGHEQPMMGRENHQELLTLLQIDEPTFKQEADSGKSLIEIAAAHNVSRQAVVDLVVKHMNEQTDRSLAEKRITKAQAHEMKKNAVEKAQQMIEMKPMGRMHGPGQYGHEGPMHDRQHQQDLLTLLKIDEPTFEQEAKSGKSLVEIAALHNVPRQDVVDFVAKQMNEQIDNRLAQSITVEQANEMKTNVAAQAEQKADIKPMELGRMHGPEQPRPIPQDMLTLLKIDEQTFKQEADSGKSLAEIGAARSVARQDIVDLLVKDMNEQVDKGLAEKRITETQATEMRTNAIEKAQQIVDGHMMEHPPQSPQDQQL